MVRTDENTSLSLKDFRRVVQNHIQLRVCNAMKMWMDKTAEFAHDRELSGMMKTFIREQLMLDHPKLARSLRLALVRATSSTGPRELAIDRQNQPAPIIPKRSPTDGEPDLWEFDAVEAARQFTLYEFELFRKITPSELVSFKDLDNPDMDHSNNNMKRFINHSNEMSTFVSFSIVNAIGKAKGRAGMYTFWANVLDQLIKINNFSTGVSVLLGLSNPAVTRLHQTQKYIKKDAKAKVTAGDELFFPGSNHRSYRQRKQSCDPPLLPQITVVLKDLTFIDDGNSNFQKGTHLIHFYKRDLVYEMIQSISRFQNNTFNFVLIRDFHELFKKTLLWHSRLSAQNKKDLYITSLDLEPKLTK